MVSVLGEVGSWKDKLSTYGRDSGIEMPDLITPEVFTETRMNFPTTVIQLHPCSSVSGFLLLCHSVCPVILASHSGFVCFEGGHLESSDISMGVRTSRGSMQVAQEASCP